MKLIALGLTLFFPSLLYAWSFGDIPGAGAGYNPYNQDPTTWTVSSGSTGTLTIITTPTTVCNGIEVPVGYLAVSADAVVSRAFPTPEGTYFTLRMLPCIASGSQGLASVFIDGNLIFERDEMTGNGSWIEISDTLHLGVHDLTLAISEDPPSGSVIYLDLDPEYPLTVSEPPVLSLAVIGFTLLWLTNRKQIA